MRREKVQAVPTARPKVPMRRLGADCFAVVMKRGNARGAKGAGHRHLARVNWCWVQPTPGGTRCSMEGGSLRAMARAGCSNDVKSGSVCGSGLNSPGLLGKTGDQNTLEHAAIGLRESGALGFAA